MVLGIWGQGRDCQATKFILVVSLIAAAVRVVPGGEGVEAGPSKTHFEIKSERGQERMRKEARSTGALSMLGNAQQHLPTMLMIWITSQPL